MTMLSLNPCYNEVCSKGTQHSTDHSISFSIYDLKVHKLRSIWRVVYSIDMNFRFPVKPMVQDLNLHPCNYQINK